MGSDGESQWPLAPQGRVPVEVSHTGAAGELVADQLLVRGASAVAELDGGDRLVGDLEPGAVGGLQRWCAERVPGSVVRQLEVDPAWSDSWREHAVAQRAGRVLIRPKWVEPDLPQVNHGGAEAGMPGGVTVEVVVDPESTFGSGSHPTTAMCAEILGDIVDGGERVLDVGTGSGVLAVTALLLGAGSATGVDIDPAAERESTHCAELNGVADRYRYSSAGLPAAGDRYDLVVANLLVGTIEELGRVLGASLVDGGAIVLSGFLAHQRGRVLEAVGAVDDDVSWELQEGGWVAVVLRH